MTPPKLWVCVDCGGLYVTADPPDVELASSQTHPIRTAGGDVLCTDCAIKRLAR